MNRRTFTIHCSVHGCRQQTAEQAPAAAGHDARTAVHAAVLLGWLHAPDHTGRHAWYCQRHQTWDPHRGRWTVTRQAHT